MIPEIDLVKLNEKLDRVLNLVDPDAPLFPDELYPRVLAEGSRYYTNLPLIVPQHIVLSAEFEAITSNRLRMKFRINHNWQSRPFDFTVHHENV